MEVRVLFGAWTRKPRGRGAFCVPDQEGGAARGVGRGRLGPAGDRRRRQRPSEPRPGHRLGERAPRHVRRHVDHAGRHAVDRALLRTDKSQSGSVYDTTDVFAPQSDTPAPPPPPPPTPPSRRRAAAASWRSPFRAGCSGRPTGAWSRSNARSGYRRRRTARPTRRRPAHLHVHGAIVPTPTIFTRGPADGGGAARRRHRELRLEPTCSSPSRRRAAASPRSSAPPPRVARATRSSPGGRRARCTAGSIPGRRLIVAVAEPRPARNTDDPAGRARALHAGGRRQAPRPHRRHRRPSGVLPRGDHPTDRRHPRVAA